MLLRTKDRKCTLARMTLVTTRYTARSPWQQSLGTLIGKHMLHNDDGDDNCSKR